jgi:hypothetical protein
MRFGMGSAQGALMGSQSLRAAAIALLSLTSIACTGGGGGASDEGVAQTGFALSGSPANAAEVFGFENAADWSPGNPGPVLGLSSTHSQGSFSLAVNPSPSTNWNPVVSVPLSTLPAISSTIDIDVMLPLQQPNPYWLGAVQMYITCPSHNIYNAYLADAELTGLPLAVWNTLSFPLTGGEVSNLLGSGYSDLTLTVVLNVPSPTTGTYLLDNLRFVPLGASACGGQPNGTLCTDGNACTTVDTCQAGTCTSGAPVACGATDPCHQAGVCNPGTGLCQGGSAVPDWTPCNNGDLCTRAEACQAGVCAGGQPTCEDGDPCTVDSCDPTTGACQFTAMTQAQCIAVTEAAPAPETHGRIDYATQPDNNRCVPDAAHVLNRMNARGEVMGWQYDAAGYTSLDGSQFHAETMLRLPYFGPGPNGNLDGSYFVASFSHPPLNDTFGGPIGAQLGVAHLGFKGGNQGKMLLTNRAYNTGDHSSTLIADWAVAPNPADTYIPMGPPPGQPNFLLDSVVLENHPGGGAALGHYVVIPLQSWTYDNGVVGFFCNPLAPFGLGCEGMTDPASQPIVQLWNMATPSDPVLSSSFLTVMDPVPDGSGGNAAVSTAFTKLNNGHFLLAFYKDTPVSQMEFYVSVGTTLDDPNLFGAGNRVPDAIVPVCSHADITSNVTNVGECFHQPYDWQTFNFINDCNGELFMIGTRGDISDGDFDVLDNFQVQLFNANNGTNTGPAYNVTMTSADQLPANGGPAPEGSKHMYCSDNSNNDQCDFQAAAGTYVDPNGQLIVYSTDYDDDGSALPPYVYGNGVGGDVGGPWSGQSCPSGTCAALGGFYRGIEFHERHGNMAPASACPTLDDAWVEFYENTNFNNGGDTNGQLFRSNYSTSNERNGYFGTNDFNDKATSVRWCVPPGSSIQIYRDFWEGPFTYLKGTGQVAEIGDLSDWVYPYTTNSNAVGGTLSGSFTTFQFLPNQSDPLALPGVPDPAN